MDLSNIGGARTISGEIPLAIVGTSELVISGFLIGIGIILGMITASFASRVIPRFASNRGVTETEFSHTLLPRFVHEQWDPSEIPTDPSARELATHEERVLRLLIANGGRMTQPDIASETASSHAKVSRLLKRMEAHGDVSRVNVGRTNLIVLGTFRTSDHNGRSNS